MASSGGSYAVAWSDFATGAIRARRFEGATSRDVVVIDGLASEPAAALLASGELVVAWRDASVDPHGDVAARSVAADGTLGSIERLTTSAEPHGPRTAEWGPSLAALPSGYVAVFHRFAPERGAGAALGPGAAAPPDLSLVESELASASAGHASVAAGPRGLFWAWSAAGDPKGAGAARSVRALLIHAD